MKGEAGGLGQFRIQQKDKTQRNLRLSAESTLRAPPQLGPHQDQEAGAPEVCGALSSPPETEHSTSNYDSDWNQMIPG